MVSVRRVQADTTNQTTKKHNTDFIECFQRCCAVARLVLKEKSIRRPSVGIGSTQPKPVSPSEPINLRLYTP